MLNCEHHRIIKGKSMKRIALIAGLLLNSSLVIASPAQAPSSDQNMTDEQYHQWLKDKFANQHEQLIPVVAVADMFYACNKARKYDPIPYRVPQLINKMGRDQLAEKLAGCLGDDSPQSDVAINFGLEGCFFEQLADKPKEERAQKMKLVRRAIASLSREERQKSLTQCVTSQAIDYLR